MKYRDGTGFYSIDGVPFKTLVEAKMHQKYGRNKK
jgi:hypothetical protein